MTKFYKELYQVGPAISMPSSRRGSAKGWVRLQTLVWSMAVCSGLEVCSQAEYCCTAMQPFTLSYLICRCHMCSHCCLGIILGRDVTYVSPFLRSMRLEHGFWDAGVGGAGGLTEVVQVCKGLTRAIDELSSRNLSSRVHRGAEAGTGRMRGTEQQAQ